MMKMQDMADKFNEFMKDINIDITRMNYQELDDFLRALIAKSDGKKEIVKARHLVKSFEDMPDLPVIVRPDEWKKSHGFIAVKREDIKIVEVTTDNVYDGDGIDFLPYDPVAAEDSDTAVYGGMKAILIDNKGGGGGQ